MAYYGRQAPRQMQGKYTRPAAGLNAYTPSHEINDNLMSGCLDALPYLESGIRLDAASASTAALFGQTADNVGQVHAAISDVDAAGLEHIIALTESGAFCYIVDYNVTNNTFTKFDISATGIPAALTGFDRFSVCRYNTEATRYVAFVCDAVDKLIWYDGATTGSIALAFTPTKIVSHANRIFALDDGNTLWWSRAGNPFNIGIADSWYGTHTESTVLEDAGYWVCERERSLEEFCVLNNAIYLFGRQSIFIFQGTNYDTFNLQIIVSDFGIRGDWEVNHLAVANNLAYIVDDGNVYEFNGAERPRLISHPVFVNTGLTNGTLGGIPQIEFTGIAADRNYVYYYERWHCAVTEGRTYYDYLYLFHTATRTWWKVSGFSNGTTTLTDIFRVLYVPKYDLSGVYSVVSDWTAVRYWYVYTVLGTRGTDAPHVVTKCFNDLPSEGETLTAVVLQLQGTENDTADISLSYALTASGTTFTDLYTDAGHIFTGDLENIVVYLPVSAIAHAPHYRLKVSADGDACVLYNIERRFRTRGMTR